MTAVGTALVIAAFGVPVAVSCLVGLAAAAGGMFDRRPPVDAPPGYPEEPQP